MGLHAVDQRKGLAIAKPLMTTRYQGWIRYFNTGPIASGGRAMARDNRA